MAKYYNRNTTTIVMPFLPYRDAKTRFESNPNRQGDFTYDPNIDPNGEEFHFGKVDPNAGPIFYGANKAPDTDDPIFIVARTQNRTESLKSDNEVQYRELIDNNRKAFFGRWMSPTSEQVCIDTSAVETNMDDATVYRLALTLKQEGVMKIPSDGEPEFVKTPELIGGRIQNFIRRNKL